MLPPLLPHPAHCHRPPTFSLLTIPIAPILPTGIHSRCPSAYPGDVAGCYIIAVHRCQFSSNRARRCQVRTGVPCRVRFACLPAFICLCLRCFCLPIILPLPACLPACLLGCLVAWLLGCLLTCLSACLPMSTCPTYLSTYPELSSDLDQHPRFLKPCESL